MVKGRRKRRQPKKAVSALAVASCNQDEISSPVKKETKLDTAKKITHNGAGKAKATSRACKSPVCITSFFCTQVESYLNAGDTEDDKSVPTHTISIFTNEQSNSVNVQVDILCDEDFKTDETPVAVPIHSPSTPHRINMPNNLEDIEEQAEADKKDKKPSNFVCNQTQQVGNKPSARGRKKLNQSQTANHRLTEAGNGESTNHKLTDYFPVRRSVRKCKKAVLAEKQRDIENKVLSQVEEGLEVRYFAGKGRGVVTTREFVKGEFVVEYIGELIDQVTAKKREKLYAQDQNTGCYMYYFQHRNHQYCVDATAETDKLGRLVNHSRNGNLIARVVEVESVPHLVLTAKEDIPVGVEVTYDYGDRSREAIRHHPWLAL